MIRFLDKESVIEMHNDEIDTYGGTLGFINESLLDSALAQPKLAVQFSSPTVYDLAAIYGYHICKNHAFLDGNKRTAVATMIVFLKVNGYTIHASRDEIIDIVIAIESNRVNKKQLADWLEAVTS